MNKLIGLCVVVLSTGALATGVELSQPNSAPTLLQPNTKTMATARTEVGQSNLSKVNLQTSAVQTTAPYSTAPQNTNSLPATAASLPTGKPIQDNIPSANTSHVNVPQSNIAANNANTAKQPLQLELSEEIKSMPTSVEPAIDFSHALKSGKLNLKSASVLVVDQSGNNAIYAKNTDAIVPIASITKLMTAIIVLDSKLSLDEVVTVTEADVDTLRNSSSRLPVGAKLSRLELLRLSLMASENRAASALARSYPGGTGAFVAAMNRKAGRLGMPNTHFVDSTGLRSQNVSTAQDLVKLVRASYQYDLIRDFTTTAAYQIDVPGRRHNLAFRNTNRLVKNKSWQIGLSKTGFINESGRCLVMQAKIAAKPVIIVLLDSVGKFSRISDANRIKKWMETGITRKPRVG